MWEPFQVTLIICNEHGCDKNKEKSVLRLRFPCNLFLCNMSIKDGVGRVFGMDMVAHA